MGVTRLGVIGGGGWLAGALLRPALADGIIDAETLILSSRKGVIGGFERWPEITVTADNRHLAAQCDIIILSVRPADLGAIALDFSGKLVISVIAGASAEALEAQFGSNRIIRAMPNAAAEERQSFTPWFATHAVTDSDRAFAERLFAATGKAVQIANENQLDYFTALTGSGAAFPALLADAMIRHAVESGLSPDLAEAAVRQQMLGAGTTIAAATEAPADIVASFLDYRGTTAAGLTAMLDAGIEGAIGRGLDGAWKKAIGMGKA